MKHYITCSPGLHYIGQVHENSLLRIAFDQLSEGQLEFQQLNQHFDTIQIGLGDEKREYTVLSGKTEMKAHLMKQFPDDTEAIETFFKIMKVMLARGHIFQCAVCLKYEICFRQMTNVFCTPPGLSQEDPLPGDSKAHSTVGVFVPAEVRHRRPRLLSLPPLWHMCSRLCQRPDQQPGSPCHLFLSFLWWVLKSAAGLEKQSQVQKWQSGKKTKQINVYRFDCLLD